MRALLPPALVLLSSAPHAEWTLASDKYHRRTIQTRQGPQQVGLALKPGGTAEFATETGSVLLTFTSTQNGEAVYTDDGIGNGLTVIVRKDGALDISHVSGWRATAYGH